MKNIEYKMFYLGLFLFAIVLIFGGCATLDSRWCGWYAKDLRAAYGEPSRKIVSGTTEVWQYRVKNKGMKSVFVPRQRPSETIKTFRIRNGFIVEANEKTR